MFSFDLTTESGVLAYLDAKFPAYAGIRSEKIAGGNVNFTFRVSLKNELIFEDIAYRTIIVKHATGYAALDKDLPLPLERQSYEVAALRYANKLFDAQSLVKAAILFEHDPEFCAIIMSDAGQESKTLKELLLTNRLTEDAANLLGKELGVFLSKLHEHGRTAPERVVFAKHQWARQITAWFYHNRLVDSLNDGVLIPPIELSDSQLMEVKDNVSMMANLVLTSEETLVMGDFWTGNIIVQMNESADGMQILQNVLVIDWEVAKLGTPGNDVGQFAAEIYLPYTFYPTCSNSARALMTGFCSAYRSGLKSFDKEVVNTAIKQLGSHLTVLSPRVHPWCEDKSRARTVVEEGLAYLVGRTVPPLFSEFQ